MKGSSSCFLCPLSSKTPPPAASSPLPPSSSPSLSSSSRPVPRDTRASSTTPQAAKKNDRWHKKYGQLSLSSILPFPPQALVDVRSTLPSLRRFTSFPFFFSQILHSTLVVVFFSTSYSYRTHASFHSDRFRPPPSFELNFDFELILPRQESPSSSSSHSSTSNSDSNRIPSICLLPAHHPNQHRFFHQLSHKGLWIGAREADSRSREVSGV